MKSVKTTIWMTVALLGLAGLGAAPATADQLILDDLIVDGSACIGFDCVNGESFGFDTLRLKENNLRIKFDDTSSSASFPDNDWQLTANDSTNGGQEKFSIDDISNGRTPFTIEAAAPSHSLYVDDGGRIGLGTSTPVVELHVKDGDTPTLRLEQDGSSGFTPQTWDVAGNETNYFIRDATNGSKLPFRIRPSAPTSSLDVATSGNVGVGTSSPDSPIHVLRTATGFTADGLLHLETSAAETTVFVVENTNGAGQNTGVRLKNSAAANDWDFRVNTAGNFVISRLGLGNNLQINGNTGNVTLTGTLVTGGVGTCNPGPCDGLFAPDFEIESIDEHADFMWTNSYLEGVGPTKRDAPVNLTMKTTGLINELEKAHVYIEQLHKRLERLEVAIAGQGAE